MTPKTEPLLVRFQLLAWLFGLLGIAGAFIGLLLNPPQFFISYLVAILVWIGIGVGSMAWLMIHFLTGGKWGFPLRRLFEAASSTTPWLGLLFVPIFFGLRFLYPWMDPNKIASNKILQHKQPYLNPPSYIIRSILFFLLLSVLSWLLNHWSRKQDTTDDFAPLKRLRKLSGPGLVLFPMLATFAYVDWIMSLEADWYSTMFPILMCIGQMLSALVLMIILLVWLVPRTSLRTITSTETFHHLGSLLLAFTMMWAYLAFSQLLIIWMGDLPHEITWYLHRIAGGWRWIALAIFAFHFLVPFALLLSRATKRRTARLTTVAVIILATSAVDVWWLVTPSFYTKGIHLSWIDFAAFVGVGGIWLALFSRSLARHPLVPMNDPRLAVAARAI